MTGHGLICVRALLLAFGAGLLATGAEPVIFERRSDSGIDFSHVGSPTVSKYLVETMGGGVALLDFDADGLLDIFFVNGGRIHEDSNGASVSRDSPPLFNRLYRNMGDGQFSDVTAGSGIETAPNGVYGMGAAVGDFDNDGFPDLVVTGAGAAELYRNLGDGSFESVGLNLRGWSASAGFADFDGNGLLDLFVTRYLDWDFSRHIACTDPLPMYCPPTQHRPVTNQLLLQGSDGSWDDASNAAGLANMEGKALGVAFNDFEGDGDIDIVVANDSEPQQLLINDGRGRFADEALLYGLALNEDGGRYAGMGVDFQDYDNDGDPDVLITNLAKELYALYVNDGGAFDYRTRQTNLAQITARMSGWGVLFVDINLDGWKDIFVAQGHVLDNIKQMNPPLRYSQPPLLALNQQGRFSDVSARSGSVFSESFAGRGAAFGDLDNDGDIDVVVSVLNSQPLILYNNAADDGLLNWLTVKLRGVKSPRDGQGARVSIRTSSGQEQHRFVTTAGSYLSASDARAHFGLGAETMLEWVRIQWPSGEHQEFRDIASRQVLVAEEPR